MIDEEQQQHSIEQFKIEQTHILQKLTTLLLIERIGFASPKEERIA
jgi:hypothetical protein